MKKIQSIRGMSDLLPHEAARFLEVSRRVQTLFESYQFEPFIPPVLEKTELFCRGIGNATDIVEKEMYTFLDRNEESLSLRPEGTASVVRAALEHGLIHNQIRKFWFIGPMFRHERPQKGRYRQFYQLNAELFGLAGPEIEAETLSMLHTLWKQLGIQDLLQLEINTIGTLPERQAFREALCTYLISYQSELDEDSQRRLTTNPLRILDSKDPQTQALLTHAPTLMDYLGEASRTHFETLLSYLSALSIPYRLNPRLVRGLDYYSHTVFEWTTTHLGAQATLCGGGRYDALVSELGGPPTPAFGFAMGMERLLLLLAEQTPASLPNPDAYLLTEDAPFEITLLLAHRLREAGLSIALNPSGGSLKSQLNRAHKSNARFIITAHSHQDPTHPVLLRSGNEKIPLTESEFLALVYKL